MIKKKVAAQIIAGVWLVFGVMVLGGKKVEAVTCPSENCYQTHDLQYCGVSGDEGQCNGTPKCACSNGRVEPCGGMFDLPPDPLGFCTEEILDVHGNSYDPRRYTALDYGCMGNETSTCVQDGSSYCARGCTYYNGTCSGAEGRSGHFWTSKGFGNGCSGNPSEPTQPPPGPTNTPNPGNPACDYISVGGACFLEGGAYIANAYGVEDATRFRFPTWSVYDGQNEQLPIWHEGTDMGGGNWRASSIG